MGVFEFFIIIFLLVFVIITPMAFLNFILIEMALKYVDIEQLTHRIYKVNDKYVVKTDTGVWRSKMQLSEVEWTAFFKHINRLQLTQNRLN